MIRSQFIVFNDIDFLSSVDIICFGYQKITLITQYSSIPYGSFISLEGFSESIQYELEPFGIKIIVIEPGGVGSNFMKNLKMASKASDPLNSPYGSIQNRITEYFNQWMQNTIHPSEVAKAILHAVTSDNPEFRYVVGNDAMTALESRRSMSDREFQDTIKKQINL